MRLLSFVSSSSSIHSNVCALIDFISILDNPLLCSCELMWFPDLLKSLKDRDDEMTQKKRPMCMMTTENREYFVQSMPINRMNCVGKSVSPLNSAANLKNGLAFLQYMIVSLALVCATF